MIKKFFRLNKLLLLLPLTTLMFCFNAPKNDNEKMQTIMMQVRNSLLYLHYTPKPINDAYSQEVYHKYFEMVDASKRYFLKSDMEEFEKHKLKLDDYLNKGDLTFYNLTVERLYQRVGEIDKMTQDILTNPIDFNENEELILEPKLKTAPVTKQEQYDEWKRFIKYNILQEIESLNSKEEMQRAKKDSVQKFGLKDTIKLEVLTPEQKRIKATQEIKDLMGDTFRRFQKRKKMDWFTVYMNAYTESFDPHSNYFSPTDKEDFDMQFVGKVIGIGAQIQERKGYLLIGPLVVGAPAWKTKQITEGDKILKVRSKPKEEPVNVVGMLVDEAVRLIRGEEGTEVTLTLQKKDGTIKDVTMVREEVAIEDTFARGITVAAPKGEKYGYISLPSFNADFEDANGRNASDDIKAEILKLKKQGIKGIILDVRNNGGGSLTEVVDIMGLFMDNGPVVQVKDGNGKVQILRNRINEPVWTGPLVVLQNELSASASEILAGAVKDYGRGVVVGSPSSFGKGTVQTFIPLNRFLNSNDDFGNVKLTIQKFYRINGKSTQLKGVESDIVMRDIYSYGEIGEKFDDHAMAWDQIQPAKYETVNQNNVGLLSKRSAARLGKNSSYQLLQESISWKEAIDKEQKITLNLNKFTELMKERKAQIEKFKDLTKMDNKLMFTLTPEEEKRIKTDEVFAKKTEQWIKNLKRDLYLQETLNVISEMK